MLAVISPAKRILWSQKSRDSTELPVTSPVFLSDANRLARAVKALSPRGHQEIMKISDDLARQNHVRFQDFRSRPAAGSLHHSLFALAGDTYTVPDAKTPSPPMVGYAQGRLRILSGLYGLLRPLDGIQPHRLEMGSSLATEKSGSLYEYWGPRLARGLNDIAEEYGTKTLINCASVEYFSAVQVKALKLRLITPIFLESRGGPLRIVSFFAKTARGAMARYVLENQIADPADLAGFSYGGYRLARHLSEGNRFVFLRDFQVSSDES